MGFMDSAFFGQLDILLWKGEMIGASVAIGEYKRLGEGTINPSRPGRKGILRGGAALHGMNCGR